MRPACAATRTPSPGCCTVPRSLCCSPWPNCCSRPPSGERTDDIAAAGPDTGTGPPAVGPDAVGDHVCAVRGGMVRLRLRTRLGVAVGLRTVQAVGHAEEGRVRRAAADLSRPRTQDHRTGHRRGTTAVPRARRGVAADRRANLTPTALKARNTFRQRPMQAVLEVATAVRPLPLPAAVHPVVEELGAVGLLRRGGVAREARTTDRRPRLPVELVQPVVPGGVARARVAARLTLRQSAPVEPGRGAAARRLRADRDDLRDRLAL